MRKIYSFNTELHKVTGVQKVLMDIHHAVSEDYDAKIVGTVPYDNVHKDIGIKKEEYARFRNPFMFYKSIVVVHERKLLLLFWLLNHVLFQRIKLVYVHHNVLFGHRFLTCFPKHIVAISDSGIQNLTEYFRVPLTHITKIHNCVRDIHPEPRSFPEIFEKIKILYPARINTVKQQVEIVRHLKKNLSDKIQILFAGEGPMLDELTEITKGDHRFMVLGFRSDIYDLLRECDYMMLFSKHEGLPITLIEADMMGTPVICNSVGGNKEIVHNGENGYIIDDWSALEDCLNGLLKVNKEYYIQMAVNGRTLYERNFTFDIFREKYLTLFNRT